MSFKQGDIPTLSGNPQKLDTFTYLGSNILSTESDVNIRRAKFYTAIDWLSFEWKFDLVK